MANKQQFLSYMLKALADDNRLTLLRMMANREYTVTEMAQVIGLTEPTISHHISKLHTAGFLQLRMAGNQRFYSLNPRQLEVLQQHIAQLALPISDIQLITPDHAWIDALDWQEADKKILRDYTTNGKLNQIPAKEKKWLVVLRWIATKFDVGTRYTEQQVNAIIKNIHPDYATIRRDLVEYRFMRRDPRGETYWLISDDAPPDNLVT